MPTLNTVLSGSLSSTWEVVPSVGRTMNFSLTVRDNEAGGAATDSDEMTVTVQIFSTPFTVNTISSWPAASTQEVTWVVGESNSLPINCQTVNILFTTNGGLSFTTLASGVPNIGTAIITVPNIANTANARVLVEAADNIFFAVSNTFSITDPLSIDEFELEDLSIYPNPSNGSFTIGFDSKSGEDINIEVYDIRGRAIFTKSFNSTNRFNEQVQLNTAQSGVYLLHISDGPFKVTKKIVLE
jgi:hypothetical protein